MRLAAVLSIVVLTIAVVALAACWVPCRFVHEATGADLGEPWQWMWVWDSPANGWDMWREPGIDFVEQPDGTFVEIEVGPRGRLAVAWSVVAGAIAALLAVGLGALAVLRWSHRRRVAAA